MEDTRYVTRLRERLNKDPDSKLFLSLAEELRKREMADEAISLLREGLKRHPDFIAARVALGRLYLSHTRLQEAKAEFLDALGKSPESCAARRGLARACEKLGDKRAALQEYGRLFEMDPLDDEARTYLERHRESIIGRLNRLSGAIKARFGEQSRDVSAQDVPGDRG